MSDAETDQPRNTANMQPNCEDRFWPRAADENKTLARKAFLKLWVAGTVGGLFGALLRSVALDIQRMSLHPEWLYTADVFLRYAFLAWFVFYFLLSNMRLEYEPLSRGMATFDIVQSLCAFVAAVCLGFVLPTKDLAIRPDSSASFAAANVAIAVLAALSLCVGGGRAITTLRLSGLSAAAVGFIASVWQPVGPLQAGNRVIVSAALAFLWVILASFRRIRICQLRKSAV